MSRVIGIDGLMGSGKSFICGILAKELDYKYLSCDKIFKDEIIRDEMWVNIIRNEFKEYNFIDSDGNLNRDNIIDILFSETEEENYIKYNKINNMFLIPIVLKHLNNFKEYGEDVIIECSGLINTSLKYLCDKIVCIDGIGLIKDYALNYNEELINDYVNMLCDRDIHRSKERTKKILLKHIKDNILSLYSGIRNEIIVNDFRNRLSIEEIKELAEDLEEK